MKKTILLSSIIISLFLSSSIYAERQIPSFNGFYAGLGAGFLRSDATVNTNFIGNQELQADLDIRVMPPPPFPPLPPFTLTLNHPETIQSNQSGHIHEDSAMGNILLGYGHQIGERFYLGIEGFANWAQRDFDTVNQTVIQNEDRIFGVVDFDTTSHLATEISLNPVEYGGDLRLGFITNSMTTLLYGKVGAAFNKLELSTTNTTTATLGVPISNIVTLNATSFISGNTEKNVTGLRLGFGVEQLISCHWSLRADYTYTNYGKVDTHAFGNANGASIFTPDVTFSVPIGPVVVPVTADARFFINPNGQTLSQNASADVQSNAVTLGLSYYF